MEKDYNNGRNTAETKGTFKLIALSNTTNPCNAKIEF